MSSPDKELTSYYANCHCGAVTLTIHIPSLTNHEVTKCNCSICTRNGYLMVYPERKNIEFHSGLDQLQEYRFGDKVGAHKFCPTCGNSVLCDFGGNDVGINVRMIQDIEVQDLKFRYCDGKSTDPQYDPPKIPAISTPPTSPGLIPYPANCHCGLVTFTAFIPSLSDLKVNVCNCSICSRNGYLFVYPKCEDVVFHQGYDQLRQYSFGNKNVTHNFCSRCGSSIFVDLKGTPMEGLFSVNAVMFQDVDPREFNFKYFDGKTQLGPEYKVTMQRG